MNLLELFDPTNVRHEQSFNQEAGEEQRPKSLDLGCGTNPRNPFGAPDLYGLDIRGFPEKM